VQEVLSARLKFCRCGVLYISLLNIYKAGREEGEGREEEKEGVLGNLQDGRRGFAGVCKGKKMQGRV